MVVSSFRCSDCFVSAQGFWLRRAAHFARAFRLLGKVEVSFVNFGGVFEAPATGVDVVALGGLRSGDVDELRLL